jgi:succinate-semialdehyde dehydrogenase/glutarate-semialdehyde dehydrogenase
MKRSREAQQEWREVPVAERVRRLAPLADQLLARREELARRIGEENGKPPLEALMHEVTPSIAVVQWLVEAAPRLLAPQKLSLGWLPQRRATLYRVPFGVVLVISPWNMPFSIPFGHVVTALAAGNAVVLKPSEVTPRSAEIIAELCDAIDLPRDLFLIEQGAGDQGARLIAAAPDRIIFTGSVVTGKRVMRAAAETPAPIPVTLELGGVDAMIVRADADLELAASAAAWGVTFNGGQVCASVERLLVHHSVHESFLQRLSDKLERIDLEHDLAPITHEPQREIYDRHLADARQRGLEIHCGGEYTRDQSRLRPTLIAGAGIEDAAAYLEESFGPLVSAHAFLSDDHAVSLHNAVDYGLTASIFTRDVTAGEALGGRLRAGVVAVNEIAATLHSAPEIPWGGVRASGFGRTHGADGLLELTWPQVIERGRMAAFEPKRLWWYPYTEKQADLFAHLAQAAGSGSLLQRASAFAGLGCSALKVLARAPRL